MSGHETKMSHIELERQQAGRQSDDNEVLANHVSESFVQERLDDILDQLSAIMTEHPNQEGEEKSHVDKKVVATAIYNRKNLGRESPPLPSSPRLEDKYVAMHGQDWDCYEDSISGKVYYHNPTSGTVTWDSPQLPESSSAASSPITYQEGKETPQRKAKAHIDSKTIDNQSPRNLSLVRDSFERFGDAVRVPQGYTEVYDKDTGLISYVDESQNHWYTSQDDQGNVYFYTRTESGDARSEWSLPYSEGSGNSFQVHIVLDPDNFEDLSLAKGSRQFLQSLSKPLRVSAEVDYQGQLNLARPASGPSLFTLSQRRECSDHRLFVEEDRTNSLLVRLPLKTCPGCGFTWTVQTLELNSLELKRKGLKLTIQAESEVDAKSWTNLLNFNIESPLPDRFHFQLGSKLKHKKQSFSAPHSPKQEETSKLAVGAPTGFKKLTFEEIDWGIPNKGVAEPEKKKRSKTFRIRRDRSQPGDSTRSLQRNGFLTRSFRKMPHQEDKVSPLPQRRIKHIVPAEQRRSFHGLNTNRPRSFLERHLLRFKGGDGSHQKRPVFGNDLVRINKYKGGDALENNLPEFLVRAIKKIEDMKWTNGLYRVPGENHKVVALAYDIDNDKYGSLDGCKDIHILTSCVKLFFRELSSPLIGPEVKEILIESTIDSDSQKIVQHLRNGVKMMEPMNRKTLNYFLKHLKKVAKDPVTLMSNHALGVVVNPNLFQTVTEARRPASVCSEFEQNQNIMEYLLENYDQIDWQ